MKAMGTFTVKDWVQTDLPGERSGLPVMRVSAVFTASGEIVGVFHMEYVMHFLRKTMGHDAANQARYAGILCFEGTINGVSGSFELLDTGAYKNDAPASELCIIDYSGAGGFAGATGQGKYYADNGKMVMELEYNLKK